VPESIVDIALLAYGGPETAEQIPSFLRRLMGREPDPRTLAVVEERYRLIGGASPLPGITVRQARALEARLALQLPFPVRVRHGFLYTEPTVADCLAELDAHDVIALPLSPFASRLTTGRYRAAIDAAEGLTGVPAAVGAAGADISRGRAIPLLEGWYADKDFVQAISKNAAEALDGCDVNEWVVLFTAHNVPAETIWEGDPYVEQLQQTIAQLLPSLVPGDWKFGFQSTGRSGGEWMEPEVADVVRTIAEEGWKKVLVVPVGFVSDNVETLYDLDILLRSEIEGLGMEYLRSEPPNDSPQFIHALADVVVEYLAHRPPLHTPGRPDAPPSQG
jgi:protoporphyrin/coproporphyrin ferrochelatase